LPICGVSGQLARAMRTFFSTIAIAAAISLSAQDYTVYVGSYTAPNGSKGIYKFGFNTKTGEAGAIDLAVETQSPSFLAIHQNGRFLYAVNETGAFAGKKQGAVSAFSIDPATRKLTALNQQPSLGADPCHINVDPEGKNVLIANYTGGSVAVYPIDGDGGLKTNSSFIQHTGSGANKNRQREPHAHSINLDKTGKHAFVCDLGLDKIFIYNYDSGAGKLSGNAFGTLKAGSGPRHLAVGVDGKTVYTINELSSTLTSFSYDGNTTLKEIETVSTLPQPTPGNSTAEVVVHPSGKFVYGSNRGHNSIAVFTTDTSGHLNLVQNASVEGKIPRNFVIDPTGQFLIAANQESNSITFFKIDPATGKLTYTGKSLQAIKPVCLRFLANK
jgi:6-phosphogluconolactonase